MISKLNWMAPATVLLLAACGGSESNADDYAAANPCAAAMADNPCAAAMAANPCAAGMDKTLPVDAIRQGDKKLSANGKTMQRRWPSTENVGPPCSTPLLLTYESSSNWSLGWLNCQLA